MICKKTISPLGVENEFYRGDLSFFFERYQQGEIDLKVRQLQVQKMEINFKHIIPGLLKKKNVTNSKTTDVVISRFWSILFPQSINC